MANYVKIGNEKYNLDSSESYQLAQRTLSNSVITADLPIIDDDGEPTGETFDPDLDVKALVLAEVLSVSPLSNIGYDGSGSGKIWTSDDDPGEYLVLDASEQEEAWDDSLESYIDECILPEAPNVFANYFDREAWKSDARHDGAGHSLATYDGVEHEARIDGQWYFVYRVG